MMKRQITFNLFNGRAQVQRKISTFVLSLIMLLLVLLTACVGVLPNESGESDIVDPASEEVQIAAESEAVTDSTLKAANPELMVVERYTAVVNDKAKTGSAFYATNPELMMASRYAAPVKADSADPLKRIVRCCFGMEKWTATSSYLAANPELMMASRYAAPVKADSADPLKRIVRCCFGMEKWTATSSYLAANPELMVAGRYKNTRANEIVTDSALSALYAANPELLIAHRYAAALVEHRRHFPGR